MTHTGRVHRLLGAPELRWFVDRARRRLESGGSLSGTVTLRNPSTEQRRAIALLLGRTAGNGVTLAVSLDHVDAVIRSSGAAADLRAALEALGGVIPNRALALQDERQRWDDVHQRLEAIIGDHPPLAEWIEDVKRTGLLRRLARGDADYAKTLVAQLIGVLAQLPAPGIPLPVVAAHATGDGHALDPGKPLATLGLGASTRLGEVPPGSGAEWRRKAWASVGVLTGELNTPVLALALPGDTSTVTGRALGAMSEAGQPLHLTARQLLRDEPHLDLRGLVVFACENTAVVAEAANQIGTACSPLVCVGSHPAAAATVLLRLLARNGATIRYHGDFDWGGITIGNGIIERFGALPWRFRSADYRAAAAKGAKLEGTPVDACWDTDLRSTMASAGLIVPEERVIPDLLNDLAT